MARSHIVNCGNTGGKQRLATNTSCSLVAELGPENGITWMALTICHHSVTLMLQFKLNYVQLHDENRRIDEGNFMKIYHSFKTVDD